MSDENRYLNQYGELGMVVWRKGLLPSDDDVELDPIQFCIELHRQSKAIGLGRIADTARGGAPLQPTEVRRVINQVGFNFDYLAGRPIKVSSTPDPNFPRVAILNPSCDRLYDRDNGDGAFKRCVDRTLEIMKES